MALLLAACGGPKPAPQAPVRDFPVAMPPRMITDPDERFEWAAVHFWDALPDTTRPWRSDSAYVAGIAREKLEEQVGIYSKLLEGIPLPVAREAVRKACDRLAQVPDSASYGATLALWERYLYDPNSPVRNEDLWQVVAQALSVSSRTPESLREAYARDARLCALNAVGTRAADFAFIDRNGRSRTLYGIRAPLTILFFTNPGCPACKEIIDTLEGDGRVSELMRSGTLAIVNVYIDEDLAAWRDYLDHYPASWVTGYDPGLVIRSDLLYHVRAIPSLYLLARDKTVLLKDATTERLMDTLYRTET